MKGWPEALILQPMIMQNNHYSTIITLSILMEKNKETTLGLSVHQETLRKRINMPYPRCSPSLTAACTAHSSPLCLTKEKISPVKQSPPTRVNWIKFNILVSIYQNWLRLEPFIRYWLSKDYEGSGQEAHKLWPFLKKSKKEIVEVGEKKKDEGFDILQQIRLRRAELLKGLQPSQSDIEYLCLAQQLAKQLLSTLPLENSKWSKLRIQKHNRLLDQIINNFNEDQFKMNSDAIMHSIKQRIFFIDQMQKKFIDATHQQKDQLQQKLELLKLPFKKVFNKNKENMLQPEALFQNLWHEIQSERNKLLTKKPELRHNNTKVKNKQRYAILQKSESAGLVVKYQLKHGDYYNQAYIRSKYLKKSRKLKKSKTKHAAHSLDQTIVQMTKDSVNQLVNQITQSYISNQNAYDKEQEQINAKMAQDFMRRQQKSKPTYRQQNSTFFKKTPAKIDNSYSHYRPSISYVDGRSNKDTELSQIKSRSSVSRDRTSIFARRQSRHRPSAQDYIEKDHMSRFRSHKKLITLKNIGGVSRYTKLKEQSKKDSQMGILTRISQKLSKMQRKQYRRQLVDYRKGAFHRKGAQRKEISMQEEVNIMPENISHLNRQDFLSYFNKILAAGHLDQEKYGQLKQQVKQLVKKNQTPALQQTHAYVQKLVEKSKQEQFQCLLGEGRQQLLVDLCEVISKDERIRAKIRQQMKIFLNYSIEQRCSKDQTCNQQFVYNTTELRKVNQQLKRILCFRAQGESISFAKRLIKESNTLEQRSI